MKRLRSELKSVPYSGGSSRKERAISTLFSRLKLGAFGKLLMCSTIALTAASLIFVIASGGSSRSRKKRLRLFLFNLSAFFFVVYLIINIVFLLFSIASYLKPPLRTPYPLTSLRKVDISKSLNILYINNKYKEYKIFFISLAKLCQQQVAAF
jgi:hypothetical protein